MYRAKAFAYLLKQTSDWRISDRIPSTTNPTNRIINISSSSTSTSYIIGGRDNYGVLLDRRLQAVGVSHLVLSNSVSISADINPVTWETVRDRGYG
jgi:hypothetical protein